MNFLYPQLLFGLSALAVPIVVHLFNFRKTKKVYFSNTRFLKRVKKTSSSKLQLKHYLILLSRLLFITFLVLAFAQPYLREKGTSPAAGRLIIYLDNSLSMSAETQSGIPALDESIIYINHLLATYPKSTSVRLLTNDFSPFSNTWKSINEVKDRLTGIDYSGVSRTWEEIAERLSDTALSDTSDVYWISDFQAATGGTEVVNADSLLKVSLVPVRLISNNNVFIDSVFPENPFLMGSRQLKLHVRVKNQGDEEVRDLGVKVMIDEVQTATATLSVAAGERNTITFEIPHRSGTISKGQVSIEDYPVTFDNELYFVLDDAKAIRVLEIKGRSARDYITKVYGNKKVFDHEAYTEGNINYSRLRGADLVVLNGSDRLSSSLRLELQKRIAANKAILTIPSVSPDIDSYRYLSSMIKKAPLTDKMPLASPDLKDPFFQNIFEENERRFSMPSAKPVLSLGTDRSAVLKFQNGMPFLRKINNTYWLASPVLDDGWSEFQHHAIFVPVMYRIAAESADLQEQLYFYISDNRISTAIDTIASNTIYKLTSGEQEQELIPSQRSVDGRLTMEVPKYLLRTGFYEVKTGGRYIKTLAFNYSRSESDLQPLPTRELKTRIKGNISLLETEDSDSFKHVLKEKYEGIPLWKYAIVLALFFLLTEVLFIRFLP